MEPVRYAMAAMLVSVALSALAQNALPSFKATTLTGQVVTEQNLIGQPTVLIVTPSRAAAKETRQWAQSLRKHVDQSKVRVRDILAIDLPFFMSERDALGRAREKIPSRYHDQTWLLAESSLEQGLDIPTSSGHAFVLVLDRQGRVVARVHGEPTASRLTEVQNAIDKLPG